MALAYSVPNWQICFDKLGFYYSIINAFGVIPTLFLCYLLPPLVAMLIVFVNSNRYLTNSELFSISCFRF